MSAVHDFTGRRIILRLTETEAAQVAIVLRLGIAEAAQAHFTNQVPGARELAECLEGVSDRLAEQLGVIKPAEDRRPNRRQLR
jgi:hypothetical protein